MPSIRRPRRTPSEPDSVTSDTRPIGSLVNKAPDEDAPTFGPSRRLDFELELGFVVGVPTELGDSVPVDAFADHVFGLVLVDDRSARDIQAWEYMPLATGGSTSRSRLS